MNTLNNNTQRYGDVYSNIKSDKQYNLRQDLPVINHRQYELFTTKIHPIKHFKHNILDEKLQEVNNLPDFTHPKPLTLADKIGRAVIREQNQDLYEKTLLENQSRDIEQYMANNYSNYHNKQQQLPRVVSNLDLQNMFKEKSIIHSKDTSALMETITKNDLLDQVYNKGDPLPPYNSITATKEESPIQKKNFRGKGKKTIAKELEVITNLPPTPTHIPTSSKRRKSAPPEEFPIKDIMDN